MDSVVSYHCKFQQLGMAERCEISGCSEGGLRQYVVAIARRGARDMSVFPALKWRALTRARRRL